jgi:hypothetical protein
MRRIRTSEGEKVQRKMYAWLSAAANIVNHIFLPQDGPWLTDTMADDRMAGRPGRPPMIQATGIPVEFLRDPDTWEWFVLHAPRGLNDVFYALFLPARCSGATPV